MTDRTTPMPLSQVISGILNPGLALLPIAWDSVKARLLLLTIGQQESRFMYRRQQGNGPAVSFWQCEQGGGIKGALSNSRTAGTLHNVCAQRSVAFDAPSVWQAMQTDDLLGCAVARAVLYCDSAPLPDVGDVAGAWECYDTRNWRPGKPRPDTWPGYYAAAMAALGLTK